MKMRYFLALGAFVTVVGLFMGLNIELALYAGIGTFAVTALLAAVL